MSSSSSRGFTSAAASTKPATAPTVLVVEAPGPFVGTVFLDALPYEHVDLSGLYPFGMPQKRR